MAESLAVFIGVVPADQLIEAAARQTLYSFMKSRYSKHVAGLVFKLANRG
jgi:hypothetical protein